MAKGKASLIPNIEGKLRAVAAKDMPAIHQMASHPVCVEIGRALLAKPDEGWRYELAESAKARLDEIRRYLGKGVGRVVKALGKGERVKTSVYQGDLIFWLIAVGRKG